MSFPGLQKLIYLTTLVKQQNLVERFLIIGILMKIA